MNNYVCHFEDNPEFKEEVRASNHGHAAEIFCDRWNGKDAYDVAGGPEPYLISIVAQDVTNWTAPQTVVVQGSLTLQYEVYDGDGDEHLSDEDAAEHLKFIYNK